MGRGRDNVRQGMVCTDALCGAGMSAVVLGVGIVLVFTLAVPLSTGTEAETSEEAVSDDHQSGVCQAPDGAPARHHRGHSLDGAEPWADVVLLGRTDAVLEETRADTCGGGSHPLPADEAARQVP